MPNSASARRALPIWVAISIGLLWVNGPVLPLMAGAPTLAFIFLQQSEMLRGNLALPVLGASSVMGFVLAWTWWAVTVPRWRLWAYQRVADIASLKKWAVAVGLTWPDGHVFERTEIKSAEHKEKERELDRGRS